MLRARPSWAVATRAPHCRRSAWPTGWITFRRAAARRLSCSRESACRAWRFSTMPDRRPYIAGNWKMHKLRAEAGEYVAALLPLIDGLDLDVGICVPFTTLDVCVQAAQGSALRVIAENMHEEV